MQSSSKKDARVDRPGERNFLLVMWTDARTLCVMQAFDSEDSRRNNYLQIEELYFNYIHNLNRDDFGKKSYVLYFLLL